jgi:FKBP-type peptidyl-prolyl cis-trans isomerase 2/predicted Fe-Mo cluster-binding NifX family protein
MTLIAVPSEAPGGLDAQISAHFGHCAVFTLVQVQDGRVGDVTVLPNAEHEHGGCMGPVMLLKQHEVEALVAGGMGMRPLAGFQQVGIKVYHTGKAATVGDAVELMATNGCQEFGEAETCGGGSECGGHDHEHQRSVERPAIDGPVDVRDDRVVSFHFTLSEKDGQVIESSRQGRPARYLHGHDNLVPGLERALTGLEVGAHTVVEVSAAEGYGERNEDQVIEVPRDQLPSDVEVGAIIRAQDPSGGMMVLTVTELNDASVRLDGNHPLAGMDLVFDITIVCIEAAVPEELEHGHPH